MLIPFIYRAGTRSRVRAYRATMTTLRNFFSDGRSEFLSSQLQRYQQARRRGNLSTRMAEGNIYALYVELWPEDRIRARNFPRTNSALSPWPPTSRDLDLRVVSHQSIMSRAISHVYFALAHSTLAVRPPQSSCRELRVPDRHAYQVSRIHSRHGSDGVRL